jgi:hypothetical protein
MIVFMWIVVMFCRNKSVLYKQIIPVLLYAVNFHGFSHITKKGRPCERAPVWHEETNHISCLQPTPGACRREDGTQMWVLLACHPSRRLVKRQNIHLTASQKWQKHPSHRLVKGIFQEGDRKIFDLAIFSASRDLCNCIHPVSLPFSFFA